VRERERRRDGRKARNRISLFSSLVRFRSVIFLWKGIKLARKRAPVAIEAKYHVVRAGHSERSTEQKMKLFFLRRRRPEERDERGGSLLFSERERLTGFNRAFASVPPLLRASSMPSDTHR